MAGPLGYGRDAVRVKVTKCEGILQPEHRKFSVDPQITSFEVLQSILAKAFDIKGEFTVCYKAYDDYGQETYLSLLSDWDLDAAFLSASEPCLCLQVDLKPFEESSEEWDSGACVDEPRPHISETRLLQNRLPGLILNQVERTFNMVQRALNLMEDSQSAASSQPPRPPMSDAEFRKFLDPIGQVVHARELRTVIYLGGIDPSLRKVVWKHILNVYPDGMSGKERMDYMKRKSYEYQALRDKWKDIVQQNHGQVMGDLAYVTSMVRKDVLRTDRHHKFYGGSDDNQNIASLFNILTTFALNHPTVSYCQGMSDLASPLLVTMGDEAHAYICFCALMKRLRPNFLLDGITMTLKFQHLAEAIMFYDPEFYAYLKSHQADDLLFCYRWLLLEMKREFAFEDALRMLEVLWSSLPQMPPQGDLPLFEKQYSPPPQDDSSILATPIVKTPRENAYTKVCALRRQSSSVSLHSITSLMGRKSPYRQNQSLDETVIGRTIVKEQGKVKLFASLDDASVHLDDRIPSSCQDKPSNQVDEINNHINKTDFCSGNFVISNATHPRKELEKLNDPNAMPSNTDSSETPKDNFQMQHSPEKQPPAIRVVKNLNEFLNFTATNKLKLRDKLLPNMSLKKELNIIENEKILSELPEKNSENDQAPGITISESKFEESEQDDKSEGIRKADDGDASSPDDSTEYFPMTTSMTRELRLELENLDRQVFGSKFSQHNIGFEDSEDQESPCSESLHSMDARVEQRCDCVLSKHDSELPSDETTTEVAEICSEQHPRMPPALKLDSGKATQRSQQCSPALTLGAGGEEIFVWENPLRCPTTPDEQADLEYDGTSEEGCFNNPSSAGEIFENEGQYIKSVTPIRLLRSNRGDSLGSLQQSSPASSVDDEDSDSYAGWGGSFAPLSHRSNKATIDDGCFPPIVNVAMTNSCEEVTENTSVPLRQIALFTGGNLPQLPVPHEFGGGNPFLMFLCVTVLLQHRDYIMRSSMDYNEMAMHFDKMVRKHDVTRVLNQARHMFEDYLRRQALLNNNTVLTNLDLHV